jgi:hypothetical protein
MASVLAFEVAGAMAAGHPYFAWPCSYMWKADLARTLAQAFACWAAGADLATCSELLPSYHHATITQWEKRAISPEQFKRGA